jgi:hypothetical protein
MMSVLLSLLLTATRTGELGPARPSLLSCGSYGFHSTRERSDMARYQELLDAFADLRCTWDNLVGLPPDVIAASRDLGTADLIELERRVEIHRLAIEAMKEAIEHEAMGRVTSSGVA